MRQFAEASVEVTVVIAGIPLDVTRDAKEMRKSFGFVVVTATLGSPPRAVPHCSQGDITPLYSTAVMQ
jgi:hypothetical protein